MVAVLVERVGLAFFKDVESVAPQVDGHVWIGTDARAVSMRWSPFFG